MALPKNLRILSLVVLSLQTSAMVLILRYSRTAHAQNYIISTAILLSELLKLILSLTILFAENGYIFSKFLHRLKVDIFLDPGETVKLALPAGLYVIQNNLLFIALTNLDAATFQVTYQLKILTTAIFSWVLLGRRLSILHWFSLTLLMAGVSLVQIDETASRAPLVDDQQSTFQTRHDLENTPIKPINKAHPNTEVSWLLGVLAVLVSCLSSGFSGVYFERLIKRGKALSLSIRNIQLALFSILFASIAIYGDIRDVRSGGFFQGYSISAWAVVIIQAFGGLVVALTNKYADNILKGFATSVSIILSTLISWLLLGDKAPSFQFVLGASIVIGATFLYRAASLSSVELWRGGLRGNARRAEGSQQEFGQKVKSKTNIIDM